MAQPIFEVTNGDYENPKRVKARNDSQDFFRGGLVEVAEAIQF